MKVVEELKRNLQGGVGGNDSKRRRTAVVLRESKLGFKLVKTEDEGLAPVDAGAANVAIPKDGALGLWTADTQLKKNGDGFPYSLSMKTHIYDLEKEKKLALDKYIQDGHETKCIWKYKEFPAGTLPKVLVKDDEKKTYQFDSKAADKNMVLAAIEVCRKLDVASLVWVMRHNAKEKRMERHGVALLANSRIVVPGDGEFSLK